MTRPARISIAKGAALKGLERRLARGDGSTEARTVSILPCFAGRRRPANGCWYFGGTLFDQNRYMTIHSEEIFGPVLSVLGASSHDEVVELVNAQELGNCAAMFTRDGDASAALSLGGGVPAPDMTT
jgi:acyl-CoA reductase-like NAD-dependent aldehyde dehydrogenase